MPTGMIELTFTGPESLSEDVAKHLQNEPYDETEAHGMIGTESLLVWVIGAVLGSPVVVKLLDLLRDPNATQKITRVTLTRDGDVILENATPKQIADYLRTIRAPTSDVPS
jgi:hypothetical protein